MVHETYSIACPGCGARLRVREGKAQFKCPKCERQIIASKPTAAAMAHAPIDVPALHGTAAGRSAGSGIKSVWLAAVPGAVALLALVGYFCYSLGRSATSTPSAISNTANAAADVLPVSETNIAKPEPISNSVNAAPDVPQVSQTNSAKRKSFDLRAVPVTDMSIDQFFEYKAAFEKNVGYTAFTEHNHKHVMWFCVLDSIGEYQQNPEGFYVIGHPGDVERLKLRDIAAFADERHKKVVTFYFDDRNDKERLAKAIERHKKTAVHGAIVGQACIEGMLQQKDDFLCLGHCRVVSIDGE
jgi:predicted RNA-binding Zn-ribbon protein involved in translation (DUF1610 family)